MIFIDTNVLVDFFFVPGDQANSHRLRRVSELFEAISVGEVEALLSEVVIHETFYVLVIRGKHIDVFMTDTPDTPFEDIFASNKQRTFSAHIVNADHPAAQAVRDAQSGQCGEAA